MVQPAAKSSRRCGALDNGEAITFRLWAPLATRVDLVLHGNPDRTLPMSPEPDGHFSHTVPNLPDNQPYSFRLNNGDPRPDPCSLRQPHGIPGPSAVVRPARFRWTDANWRGIPKQDLVFYELHVGTFTPEGTFDAIIPRLADLKDLGVTAIELMPISQFPGSRNWGYDGVLPYAAQNSYGGPHALQRLVDAAHSHGLAVFLDVVYNHFGPEANYLHEFGPYFTDKYKTPWGAAVNYDDRGCDGVRDYVLDNARMWLDEFHVDGLRLDAVHAIYDLGPKHILAAIADVACDVAQRQNRHVHVVAESDLNDPRIILPFDRGGHAISAQWADDFHHAVHALLTRETRGYYVDYGKSEHLAASLRNPYVYAGHYSPHRGRRHGAPLPPRLPTDHFVVNIQNHDQVGNRALGDRLTTLLKHPAKNRLAASLMLLSPYLPLLFMGEEYGETNPFPFFCSFCSPDLLKSVCEGRRREFADFVASCDDIPDPGDERTFQSAKLSWSWPEGSDRARLRRLYRTLLAARRTWPSLRDFSHRHADLIADGTILCLRRGAADHPLVAFFNLTNDPRPYPRPELPLLFSSEDGDGARLQPWECLVFGQQ